MLIFRIFILAFAVAVIRGDSALDAKQAKRGLYVLGHANNNFAVHLHRKLLEETGGNVFFSPYSVSSVLAMLYSGARGETATQLRKVLCFKRLNDSTIFSSYNYYLTEVLERIDPKWYTIHSVSAMVVDRSFPVLQQYKTDMRDIFQAYVQEANIAEEKAAVVDSMNTWAKIKTRGVIGNLADDIDPDTTLFLASAAYFKGAWKVKFDRRDTKEHPFYNGGQRTNVSEVQMMHSHASYRYFEDDDQVFTAVELLYEGRNMSMVIYLPKQDDGLRNLEGSMTAALLSQVRRQMYFTKVHLTMPKFKLEYDRSLSTALQDLGATKIFRKTEADLSGMIAQGSALVLNDVKHKASIEVNEQGSIASAVTRAIMTKSLPLPMPDPIFNVNHPFLFAIFDCQSGMILFMGRVTNL